MFIAYYELDNSEPYFDIYYKNKSGYEKWYEDTWNVCNIEILDFKISGKSYEEKKNSLEELAKKWQLDFSWLCWCYGDLGIIQDYFYRNAKRYGLLKEFRQNGIC